MEKKKGHITVTCKDCKSKRKCENANKSFLNDPDGDSWANWCDDFVSKHKSRTVHYKGLTAVQSGYNYHVMIYSETDEKVFCHLNCTKRHSKCELKKDIKLYLQLLTSARAPDLIDDKG